MSNLKTPNLSYANLNALLGARPRRAVAYATTAARLGENIAIYHHGNLVAEICPDRIWLSMSGYNTNTTKERLDKILVDNYGWQNWRVRKSNYETILVHADESYRNPKHYLKLNGNDVVVHANGTAVTA